MPSLAIHHLEGVHDSLQRAAAHLPRVDAIGGSAAGVYVNNEVRVASLFRGVPPDEFERHIRRMFFTLQARWGGVPFEVANDGEADTTVKVLAKTIMGNFLLLEGSRNGEGYVVLYHGDNIKLLTADEAKRCLSEELKLRPREYEEVFGLLPTC